MELPDAEFQNQVYDVVGGKPFVRSGVDDKFCQKNIE